MSINFTPEGETPEALLVASQELYRSIAVELAEAARRLVTGETTDAKAALHAVREMRAAFVVVMDERTRVDKLRTQIAGVEGDVGAAQGGLDFDAARDEIGRRLACLRAAGGGG